MADPFIGEIRMFAGNFAPVGWAFCDGSLLPISENDALFIVMGTTYGGDGQETFGLPDLRGRVPVHSGLGDVIGTQYGVEQVTLTTQQIPAHTHSFASPSPASRSTPQNNALAQAEDPLYAIGSSDRTLGATSLAGGSQPHDNRQPYVGINFIISLFGIFPSPP